MVQNDRKDKPARGRLEDEIALIERGVRGDVSAMHDLCDVLDAHPAIWQRLGNLAAHNEKLLVDAIAGKNLTLTESLWRVIAEMKEKLGAATAPLLEQLQIEQIIITWLQMNYYDQVAAAGCKGDEARQITIQRLQDAAHRRHRSAALTFALIRQMSPAAAPQTVKRPKSRVRNKA